MLMKKFNLRNWANEISAIYDFEDNELHQLAFKNRIAQIIGYLDRNIIYWFPILGFCFSRGQLLSQIADAPQPEEHQRILEQLVQKWGRAPKLTKFTAREKNGAEKQPTEEKKEAKISLAENHQAPVCRLADAK